MTPIEQELKDLGQKYGVRVWEQSRGHWKIQDGDGQIINYWPTSKKRTCHIETTSWSRVACEPMDVLRLAVHGAQGARGGWEIPLDRVQGSMKTPKQAAKLAEKQKSNNDRNMRRPAGEKIGPGMYAAKGDGFDQKLAALDPKAEGAPWQ